jgi:hypothetical protein
MASETAWAHPFMNDMGDLNCSWELQVSSVLLWLFS